MAGQALARFAQEVPDNPTGDILQIDGPLPQVWIINGGQGFDEFVDDALEYKLGIVFLPSDPVEDLLDQGGVFEHQ